MIYLDNAATSRFKPKSVLDALNFDILHSANPGRSGHDEALSKSIAIERARGTIKKFLGADENYSLIFTKNCTEALNLAIFGTIKGGERVVTSTNEHNSVLRPLLKLEKDGKIKLSILKAQQNGKLNIDEINKIAKSSDVFVFGGACNVTGASLNIAEVGKIAKQNNVKLIVDGAQSVPYFDFNMKDFGVTMLACPGHKGLHGIQGTGFLIVDRDAQLAPLLYGGTGTYSEEVFPPIEFPESFEAGTLFAGGIAALEKGVEWTYNKLNYIKKYIDRLTEIALLYLKDIGATIYTKETHCGVVAFNLKSLDSAYVSDILNENGIAVRAGLHCAPLVHRTLGTLRQGAVRISIGCDNTSKDLKITAKVLENIMREASIR